MKTILGMTVFLMAWSTAVFGQCIDADKKALEAFDKAWTAAGQTAKSPR